MDSQYIRQVSNYILKTNQASATLEAHITTPKLSEPTTPTTPIYQNYDVVIYGDEVPGVCAAIWAKKSLGPNGKVALVRSNHPTEPLGGVLTRGGLGYVDLDKIPSWYSEPYAQCFLNFLDKAQVSEACLEVKTGDIALKEMLSEAGVTIVSGSTLTPHVAHQKIEYVEVKENNIRIKADSYIDTTQDAELARKAGLSYYRGYESQSPKLRDATLSVSLVPTITGLTISDLKKIEDDIIYNQELVTKIESSINKYQDTAGAEFWMRNFWQPIYQPYRDGYNIRSSVLGAAYHLEHNKPFTQAGFFFDRANICIYKDNSLSWNGFLFKYPVDKVIELEENGRKPNSEMIQEMSSIQAWLQKLSGKDVRLFIPDEIYIRQTLNIRDVVDPLTGEEIIKGGTEPEKSIGSFSYDFDLRGGVKGLSIKIPPLPVYNFGIESALATKVNNLAIVGRSSGYVGMAVSVGRILTVNIYQGQGIGVAAAIARQLGVPLNTITSRQVREEMENLTGKITSLYGRDTSEGVDYRDVK
ncbi:FAD-dependent oxidoreductase [Kamptonema animale]|uniref:FAD-dependent oxidoreductase n=1 Tax=Kamptonema animale TaxID=92934 RepID=UPI00232D1FD9|nr:FAD-dependent oxidoreductase [Kamptonema animale]